MTAQTTTSRSHLAAQIDETFKTLYLCGALLLLGVAAGTVFPLDWLRWMVAGSFFMAMMPVSRLFVLVFRDIRATEAHIDNTASALEQAEGRTDELDRQRALDHARAHSFPAS